MSERPGRSNGVIGPAGKPLTVDNLPPADTKRWVIRRKAEVVIGYGKQSFQRRVVDVQAVVARLGGYGRRRPFASLGVVAGRLVGCRRGTSSVEFVIVLVDRI